MTYQVSKRSKGYFLRSEWWCRVFDVEFEKYVPSRYVVFDSVRADAVP